MIDHSPRGRQAEGLFNNDHLKEVLAAEQCSPSVK